MKPSDIKPGMELYVGSSIYIDHGEDDRCGGIAIVKRVQYQSTGNPINDWFVYFRGLDSGFNLTLLLREQNKLAKEYGNRMAHQCPEGTPCPNPRRGVSDVMTAEGAD